MNHVFTLIAIAFLTANVSAQIITRQEIEERTEQKVEQRVDRRVDQSIDKGLDVLEGALFGRRNRQGNEQPRQEQSATVVAPADGVPPTMATAAGVALEELYEFDAISVVNMTSTNKRGRSESNQFKWLYSSQYNYFAMEASDASSGGQTALIIYDMGNRQMVTLMENDGQDMAMVMPLDASMYEAVEDEEMPDEQVDGSFTKTGRTKDIAGYACDEYTFTSGDGSGEIWISQRQDIKMGFSMNAFGASPGGNSVSFPEGYPLGNVMEMTSRDSEGGSTHFETIEVQTNLLKMYNMAGYTVMNMGGFGR